MHIYIHTHTYMYVYTSRADPYDQEMSNYSTIRKIIFSVTSDVHIYLSFQVSTETPWCESENKNDKNPHLDL